MESIEELKNIKIKRRSYCVVCGKKCGSSILKMPHYPLTEIYVEKQSPGNIGFADQEFYLCDKCGHGQLLNIIDQAILYGKNYVTRTTTSSSAIVAIETFMNFIFKMIKGSSFDNIIEIGCNDLYTLKKLKKHAKHLFGIDPILKGREKEYSAGKIRIIGDFYENVDLNALGIEPDIVISSNTLEHLEDPKRMIERLLSKGSKKTLYFFQFPSLEYLLRDCRFDQIFHQHLNYFSRRSVSYLLRGLDCDLINMEINPYHWGTMMIAFRKGQKSRKGFKITGKGTPEITKKYIEMRYQVFKDCMRLAETRIANLDEEVIYGYGAALMLPILGYYINNLNRLKYIIDEDESKNNMYYLNLPIQIKSPKEVVDIKRSAVVVTAINSMQPMRQIINKLIGLKVRQIILPINII
jgi:hypothetical protein